MTNRPRVLFVDQTGELGGAELSLLDIVRKRKEGGYKHDQVALFADGPLGDRLRSLGVTVAVTPFTRKVSKQAGFGSQIAAGPAAWRGVRQLMAASRDSDVIYANTQKAIVLAGVAARLTGKPMVAHLHDVLDAVHFSGANRWLSVRSMNACAKIVVANSQATADAYRRAGGKRRTVIAHNGIDAAPFDLATDNEASAVRRSLTVADETPLIGIFGRITEWKGHRVLLEAIRNESLSGTHLVVVGDALFTEGDRRLAEQLRALSSSDGLVGRVHWLGHRHDIPQVMKACDVIVHCSTQPEPFGRVIVEGQLAGRPVIAAASGGALEIIEDEVNGLLTAPGDAAALAAAIQRLIADSEFANSLANAGAQSARTRFTLDSYAAIVNDAIQQAPR